MLTCIVQASTLAKAAFQAPWRNKVRYLPLGLTSNFGRTNPRFIRSGTSRRNLCLFIGSINDNRLKFLEVMRATGMDKRCRIQITEGWGKGLHKLEYKNLLLDTTFTLCPAGNFAKESFRVEPVRSAFFFGSCYMLLIRWVFLALQSCGKRSQ